MAVEFKYPENIGNPEFKYRSMRIKVFESAISKTASEAISRAKKVTTDFAKIVFSGDDKLERMNANLKHHQNAKIRQSGNLLTSITLPLPNNFQDNQSHSWSTEKGIIGTASEAITNFSVGGLAKKITGGRIGGPDITIDKAIGSISSSFGSRKPIIDPGYFQNYTGTEPRAFQTTFNFIPSNHIEAESIIAIIMKFKQYASPQRTIGVGLLAPYFFTFEFSNTLIQNMIKVDRVVLKDINIDYGADGAMQMMGDGVPKYISVSMTWQEVDLTTSNDYSHIPDIPDPGSN